MQPLPQHAAILEAVAAHLKSASKVPDPGPAGLFGLRLASSLSAMVGRELRLQKDHERAHRERLEARFGPSADQTALLAQITEGDLSPQDWSELLRLVRADLADQLEVIAPHFDTSLEVESP